MELRQHNSESDQKKHTKMGDRVTGWRIKDGSLGPAGRSIDAASDQCHSHCFCLFLFQDVTIYNVYRYIYIYLDPRTTLSLWGNSKEWHSFNKGPCSVKRPFFLILLIWPQESIYFIVIWSKICHTCWLLYLMWFLLIWCCHDVS